MHHQPELGSFLFETGSLVVLGYPQFWECKRAPPLWWGMLFLVPQPLAPSVGIAIFSATESSLLLNIMFIFLSICFLRKVEVAAKVLFCNHYSHALAPTIEVTDTRWGAPFNFEKSTTSQVLFCLFEVGFHLTMTGLECLIFCLLPKFRVWKCKQWHPATFEF